MNRPLILLNSVVLALALASDTPIAHRYSPKGRGASEQALFIEQALQLPDSLSTRPAIVISASLPPYFLRPRGSPAPHGLDWDNPDHWEAIDFFLDNAGGIDFIRLAPPDMKPSDLDHFKWVVNNILASRQEEPFGGRGPFEQRIRSESLQKIKRWMQAGQPFFTMPAVRDQAYRILMTMDIQQMQALTQSIDSARTEGKIAQKIHQTRAQFQRRFDLVVSKFYASAKAPDLFYFLLIKGFSTGPALWLQVVDRLYAIIENDRPIEGVQDPPFPRSAAAA